VAVRLTQSSGGGKLMARQAKFLNYLTVNP